MDKPREQNSEKSKKDQQPQSSKPGQPEKSQLRPDTQKGGAKFGEKR